MWAILDPIPPIPPKIGRHLWTFPNVILSYRFNILGAPLMLNEVVFFHKKSSTLIVADAFYSGHCCNHYGLGSVMSKPEMGLKPPNVFTRIWFKLTKDHWCSPQLPSYRTTRVVSNGNPGELISCIWSIIQDWAPKKMICAHGDRVVEENPGNALIQAWTTGVLMSKC